MFVDSAAVPSDVLVELFEKVVGDLLDEQFIQEIRPFRDQISGDETSDKRYTVQSD